MSILYKNGKMEKKVFRLQCLTTLVSNLPLVTDLRCSFTLVYQAWPNLDVESWSYCC